MLVITDEPRFPHLKDFKPSYRDFRAGDARHSLVDIDKARTLLGYDPAMSGGSNSEDILEACSELGGIRGFD